MTLVPLIAAIGRRFFDGEVWGDHEYLLWDGQRWHRA